MYKWGEHPQALLNAEMSGMPSPDECLASIMRDSLISEEKAVEKKPAANREENKVSEVEYVFTKPGIPLEALKQAEKWYDRNGVEHAIAEMHPSHAYFAGKKLKTAYGIHGTRSELGKALTARAGNWRPAAR